MDSKTVQSENVTVHEKELISTITPNVTTEANESAVVRPERNLSKAIWTIVWGVALPCIPIIIVSAILLYIIFHHQIVLDPGWPALQLPKTEIQKNGTYYLRMFRQEGGKEAYYVQFNPSTITTIASWTSRVIPYLSSSIMALVAFFAARHIVLKSKHGDESQLPNPEQLAILISMLGGGGFGTLKDTLVHRWVNKNKLINPLPAAFGALATITFLGLIIPLIDTWFGVATKAKIVTQLYPRNSSLAYGVGLSLSTCPNGPRDNGTLNPDILDPTAFWPCNVATGTGHGLSYPEDLAEAANIQLGVSNLYKIQNYTAMTGETYYYLGHTAQNTTIDYQAKTIATSSQCKPMSQSSQCTVALGDPEGAGATFSCNPAFTGSFGLSVLNKSNSTYDPTEVSPNVGVAFSGNPELTDVNGGIACSHITDGGLNNYTFQKIYTTNPLYYGVWAKGYPGPTNSETGDFKGDDFYTYVQYMDGGIWLLNCSTTVYEVTYNWVNGAVQKFDTTMASTDLAALLSAPFGLANNAYVQQGLTAVASIAGSTNSSTGIAQTWSTEFSRALLAYSIGAMESNLNGYEQGRDSTIPVARVPLAPLYLLLGVKALYVIAVIVLGIGAYCFTHPAETEVVKAQLSVKGLAAAHFDEPDLLQRKVVQEIQSRLNIINDKGAPSSAPNENNGSDVPAIKHAESAPLEGNTAPKDVRIGLIPTVDGTWQFVMKANGVWNIVKPIVENLVVTEATSGQLGAVGDIVKAWH